MNLLVLICLLLGANAFEGYEGPTIGSSCNDEARRDEPRGQESAESCMVYCQLEGPSCVGFTYYPDVVLAEKHRRCSLCFHGVAGKEFHDSHNAAATGYKKVPVANWVCPSVWDTPEVGAVQNVLASCDGLLVATQAVADSKEEVARRLALVLDKEKEEALRAAEVASSQHANKVRELTADLNEQRSAYTNLAATHTESQGALQKEKEELQNKIDADTAKLRTELEALRTQLKNKQTQHEEELEQTKARMTQVNTVSEERIGELEAQVEALNGAQQDATQLQAKLDQALVDRAAWETTLREAHAQELAKLQARSTEAETALKKCTDPTPEDEATNTATVKAEVALEIAVSNLELTEQLGEDACSKLEPCPGEDGKFEIPRTKGSKGLRATCHDRGCHDQNARETDGTWVPAGKSVDRKGVKLICVKPCAKEAKDRAAVLTAEKAAEKAAANTERAARSSQNLAIFSAGARLSQLAAKVRTSLEAEARQISLDAQVAAEWEEQARRREEAADAAKNSQEADKAERARRKTKYLAAQDMKNGPARVEAAREETATLNRKDAHEAGENTCLKVPGSTHYGEFLFKNWAAKLKQQAVQPEGQGCQNTKTAREAICTFQHNNERIRLDDMVKLFEGKKVNCRKYGDTLKKLIGNACKDITDKKTGVTVTLCDKRSMK